MNKNPNKLISEKSPYLLQHAYNAVEWYPWGEEAFSKAKKEDKPVFLSIGYSTCHWCHVMEKESFEDEQTAGLMNRVFVSVKVDREERPDIDHIYMTVCQMMTGGGGWPLSVVITPDKKPFFAGTYFPKESRFGRIGFIDLILNIEKAWKEKRSDIESSADSITEHLQSFKNTAGKEIDDGIFNKTFQQFKNRFDKTFGGFGTAPKFPSPHNLIFLLRYHIRSGSDEALEMTEKTLTEMRNGGLFDQIGFGFHRYSTDKKWFLPHFEKMLYDQAMLAMAYTEAYQAVRNLKYKNTVYEIFEYVLRDMTSPEGGFYSAEDADSEGEEGKFYLWSEEELRSLLGENDSDFIIQVFNIEKNGNYYEEASRKAAGTNILYLKNSTKELADKFGLPEEEFLEKLNRLRSILFNEREKRIHPLKDTKILADWNGLMIAALSTAGRVFDETIFIEAALKAADFIFSKMIDDNGNLTHRYKDGVTGLNANLDDYVFIIWGLIELYEATFNSDFLKKAIQLNNTVMNKFHDGENGGFFFTADDSSDLIVRTKEYYDGAIPSGNSVAAMNLLRLGRYTSDHLYDASALRVFNSNSLNIENSPSAFTHMITAFNFAAGPAYEILIIGDKESAETKKMIETVNEFHIPNKVVMLADQNLKELFPYLKNYTAVNLKTTVYICRNYVCELPVTDAVQLKNMLSRKP